MPLLVNFAIYPLSSFSHLSVLMEGKHLTKSRAAELLISFSRRQGSPGEEYVEGITVNTKRMNSKLHQQRWFLFHTK